MTHPLSSFVDENERHRLLLEAITDYAIYMLDAGGHVSSWNTGAQKLKGYREEEILGAHFSCFYTSEDRAAGRPNQVLATAAAANRFEGEGWRLRKDGTTFWAHVIVDPIRSRSGQLLGYAKITRDLTDKKKTEEALRQSQEQFRLLVQGVIDYAIYMLDPEGNVVSWNAGAERIKGYAPEEILGEHFSRFYSDGDRANGLPWQALETARREGRFANEGWRLRKDGSRFWASVVVDAIHNDAGELIGFAKITRDITDKRQAEEDLKAAQEGLLQARKLEALGELAGGIAHDFNNLLMAISGSLELLQRRIPDDPRAARLLGNALDGIGRGKSLTERLLAFSRRQPLMPQPVDLPALLREMNELLKISLGDNISLEVQSPVFLPDALVDSAQLELSLLNIASNARDAMPRGGRLTFALSREDGETADLRPGLYLRVAVTDTGEGMDSATLIRAADPFFTTKGPGKGTGLGLSVVHGFMEDTGGRMRLQSEKGEGTTVELWIPTADSGSSAPRAEQGAEEPETLNDLVVLAVDDDALVLMNTVMMLEDLGCTVLKAPNGTKALDQIGDREIDLLITDHAMPGMTGMELIETAQRLRPELKAILATGYLELPDGRREIHVPKLGKPFDMTDLETAIRAAVAQSP
jgi:PAS domain S-box-containing protein